jgi:hypothetical protein
MKPVAWRTFVNSLQYYKMLPVLHCALPVVAILGVSKQYGLGCCRLSESQFWLSIAVAELLIRFH